jgi:hypothetical protein
MFIVLKFKRAPFTNGWMEIDEIFCACASLFLELIFKVSLKNVTNCTSGYLKCNVDKTFELMFITLKFKRAPISNGLLEIDEIFCAHAPLCWRLRFKISLYYITNCNSGGRKCNIDQNRQIDVSIEP